MALDATIGGDTADSYVTLSEANTYFANHYSLTKGTDWAALLDPQKESALRRATQILDGLRVLDNEFGSGALPIALVEYDHYDLSIHRLDIGQALNFPRNIDIDTDGISFVPQAVLDAQCEQAIFLVTFDDATLQTRLSGIIDESITAGPVRIHQKFKDDGSSLAPMAYELMRQFLRPTRKFRRA